MRRLAVKVIPAALFVATVTALMGTVVFDMVASGEASVRGILSCLVGIPVVFYFAWRYYIAPGIRLNGGSLVVCDPGCQIVVPWQEIVEVRWVGGFIGSGLCIAVRGHGDVMPVAFKGAVVSMETRHRLIAAIEEGRVKSDAPNSDSFAIRKASLLFECVCTILLLSCSAGIILSE